MVGPKGHRLAGEHSLLDAFRYRADPCRCACIWHLGPVPVREPCNLDIQLLSFPARASPRGLVVWSPSGLTDVRRRTWCDLSCVGTSHACKLQLGCLGRRKCGLFSVSSPNCAFSPSSRGNDTRVMAELICVIDNGWEASMKDRLTHPASAGGEVMRPRIRRDRSR